MNPTVDLLIVGAGPVGLMCAYLAHKCGLSALVVDRSLGPLEVGRADALNARTLQLLEIAGLFSELYPLGKPCNTSSVWADGAFVSRQSTWWDELEGCFHKHFLMLGQSFVEKLLDQKLQELDAPVRRGTSVNDIQVSGSECLTRLSTGEVIASKYVIGADGSRSFVREFFQIPFEITRPQMIWAVIDGVIQTDFPKVPEIIVFQNETSDVAWIPREGAIDRFYVRMDTAEFKIEDAVEKVNRAIQPHTLTFQKVTWFSRFSVKESVAEQFRIQDRVFLAGDAAHIHSVNGGQGLNTGIADAFNLIWKLKMHRGGGAPESLLSSYEAERKPVALSVIQSSGELVRSTKYSERGTHAQDYVEIVRRRAGNITGMGIRYGTQGLVGARLFDMKVWSGDRESRLYSLLDYSRYSLCLFGDRELNFSVPSDIQVLRISANPKDLGLWTDAKWYQNSAVLVRPDSYIESVSSLEEAHTLMTALWSGRRDRALGTQGEERLVSEAESSSVLPR